MLALLDRPDRSGLVANVACALTIVVLVNAFVFGLGWDRPSQRAPAFVPPPIAIAIVWIALFACMAIARWELNRARAGRVEKAGLVLMFALCATYPCYTAGLRSDTVGEIANVTLLLFAGALAVRYAPSKPRASAWLLPLVLWLAFASIAGSFAIATA